jgi:hypothetical protein
VSHTAPKPGRDPQPGDRKPGDERIWFPSIEEVIAQRNAEYFHSLWLGTVGALLMLPHMFLIQMLFPLVAMFGQAVMGFVNIVMQVIQGTLRVIFMPLFRWFRLIVFGVLGYLDTEVEADRYGPVIILPRVQSPEQGADTPESKDTPKRD